ncbi:hypothetical protein OIU77_024390 [Salix suchowensis]|uniref:Uncharacterized protein n=1 Tax=Salix suchowensis TaxID=1278906 RepID=A0ABQ9BSS4_9ROSI|nr:hypothetical protein OIU77_024390 [Salix suchowensis]
MACLGFTVHTQLDPLTLTLKRLQKRHACDGDLREKKMRLISSGKRNDLGLRALKNGSDQGHKQRVLTFLLFTASLTFPSLIHSLGAKCAADAPSVQQTQVGNGYPPKFMVQVQNNCPMCPVINIHLKCGGFPQALVNPRLLKVVAPDDCVVNGGLPLSPLQKISFNYSHQKFLMHPSSWSFQCE